jgi:hypothetical protein
MRVVPAAAGRVWAATCGWVYRGEAFGEHWTRVKEGFAERRTRAFDALSPERLIAGTVAGAYLSTDGGASFERARDPGLSIVALAHHPARPDRVLAATDGAGIWRSLDGGASYEPSSRGLAALRVAAVVVSAQTLYAAVRSLDGGARFERLEPALPAPLGLAVAEGRLFVAADDRLVVRDGEAWRTIAGGDGRRVSGLRELPSSFEVLVGDRRQVWRDGRLAAAPDGSVTSAGTAPALPSSSLPRDAVRGVAPLGGRLVLATAGFGLRWADPAPTAAPSSVALEAGEDTQVGGEPLGRER